MKETEEKQTPEFQEVYERAILEFNNVQTALRDEREQNLEDRRFASISGAQWEGDLEEYYENRPKIEVNKIQIQLKRINNDFRNNRASVNYRSKNGQDEKLAEVLDGLHRADELDSNAREAYNNAFLESSSGGFGAWRLLAKYEDEFDDENTYQRICITPITDADSCVFFDLNAKRQDKKDATKCWVLTPISKDAYKETYDDEPSSVQKQVDQSYFDWNYGENVYIAEYYEVEHKPHTVLIYQLQDETEVVIKEEYEKEEDFEDKIDELQATGWELIKQKQIKKQKVHKYIMNGMKILKDCGYIAGTEIPIIPVYGERWFIDGTERCAGLVRFTKDAQRLKNIQMSSLAEIASLFKTEKPILTPEQIAGNEEYWRNDNIENYPFMLINPTTNEDGSQTMMSPLGYTKVPSVPPALATLMAQSDADIQELLSRNPALEALNANMSGEAISKLIDNQDVQNSIYQSNFTEALKRSGEVYMSMARDIYVEEDREMKSVDSEGVSSSIKLKTLGLNDQQIATLQNDFTKINFDVYADIGSSTSSKRQATVKNILNAMQATADQETISILSNLLVMNMEGEGLDELRPYFRKKLINIGALQPTEEEKQELLAQAQMQANQAPSAQEQFFMSEANKNNAQAQKTQADTIKSIADTQKIKAETVETLTDVQSKNRDQLMSVVETLNQGLNQQPAVSQPPLQETGR